MTQGRAFSQLVQTRKKALQVLQALDFWNWHLHALDSPSLFTEICFYSQDFSFSCWRKDACQKPLFPDNCVPSLNAWYHQNNIFIKSLLNSCFKENNLGLFCMFNMELLFWFCFALATVMQIRITWDQRFPQSCRKHNVCAGAMPWSGIWALCWKETRVVFFKGHRSSSQKTGIFTRANSEVLS